MKRLALPLALAALAVFAPASALAAPVGVGHSGWNWGNPQPQGNTLVALEFEGSTGFAAGYFGTLLRTEDGGRSWTAVRSGNRESTEWHISIAGSSAVLGGGCYLGRSDDGGLTFRKLPGRCLGTQALSFPSPLRGFRLLGGGGVQRTDDGVTFTDVGPIPQTGATGYPYPADTATDIFFTDSNTGFAVSQSTGPAGFIYRTTDGGQTWFQRAHSTDWLNSVYFPDAATGYAVGRNNTVLKTTDGGETWNPKPVPATIPPSALTSIRCGSSTNCMAVSQTLTDTRLLHTTDGGNSWTPLDPSTERLHAVAYSSNSDAVAVGENGATVITTNATSNTPTFVRVGDDPLQGRFTRLRSGSPDVVLAPGQSGRLGRSTDGGRHWRAIQLPTSEDLRDAWFVDGEVGFALDASGRTFRTPTGGDDWSEFGTAPGVQPTALYAPDQSTILLFGPTGVRRGTGGSFEPVGDEAMQATSIHDYDRTGGGVIFAYGERELFRSLDAGVTWKHVKPPTRNPRPDYYRKVDFVTRNVGFVVLQSGRLFRTGNGGKRWREVLSTGSKHLTDVSFPDASNGFLANRGLGTVLRTTDGGSTWHPQLFSPYPLEEGGLVAPDADTAFAKVGFYSGIRIDPTHLFFTHTGGDLATKPSTLALKPSRTVIRHARRVKITGKLTPGQAGARVEVLKRDNTTHRWLVAVFPPPKVNAAGRFTFSPLITNTTQVVAQWAGNEKVKGAGSRYVTIRKR